MSETTDSTAPTGGQEQGSAQQKNQRSASNIAPDLSMLLDVSMTVVVEVGKAEMALQEILSLRKGTVIELDKFADEPMSIYANGKHIANGEVVAVNGKYGIRLTELQQKVNEHS